MLVRTPLLPAAGRNAKGRPGTDFFAPERQEQVLLAVQQAAFDTDMQCKAENQREANAFRDLQMEQMKRDDEIVKKWIELI
ncbi:MAG: hypothetical protein M3N19_11065 [Candidatus Eremiobacteraeota bacterium]|nr:hypothetical protein [Candidatus Eremiobacteraeota bacterium]